MIRMGKAQRGTSKNIRTPTSALPKGRTQTWRYLIPNLRKTQRGPLHLNSRKPMLLRKVTECANDEELSGA
jgi:hypothetical protein